MVSILKFIMCIFFLITIQCSLNEPESYFSEEQASVIRQILRENGYVVSDNEAVDTYVKFISSSEHYANKAYYHLLLPAKNEKILVLDDKLNKLDSKFSGIECPQYVFDTIRNGPVTTIFNYGIVDSIQIKSDSLISIKSLSIYGNKLKSIPVTINYLKGNGFDFENNQISMVPIELMSIQATTLSDTVKVYIQKNKIDTTTISETLDKWLQIHCDKYWKTTQKS